MDKASVNYILCLCGQRILGFLLFLLGSKGAFGKREIIYFSIYIAAALINCLVLFVANPRLLFVRRSSDSAPWWDKVFPRLLWVTQFFFVYIAAGFGYVNYTADIWFYIGTALCFLSEMISLWAKAVNSSFMFLPQDQCEESPQTVCRSGPYSCVRHPAYASALLWCFSICLVFPHLYVAEAAIIVAFCVCILTYLEDRALLKGLHGYAEYSEEVEFRLIPYLW